MRLLLIDNYDSFTFTLRHLLLTSHPDVAAVDVVRNDAVTVDDIVAARYDGVVISPGPDDPDASGVSLALLRAAVAKRADVPPVFGVCLGHQALGVACGGAISVADEVVHGKASLLGHAGGWLFAGVECPFAAMRYHSLIVAPGSVAESLQVVAWLASERDLPVTDRIPMAFVHSSAPLASIQFHPESIGTFVGSQIAANVVAWMAVCSRDRSAQQRLENRCESTPETDSTAPIG